MALGPIIIASTLLMITKGASKKWARTLSRKCPSKRSKHCNSFAKRCRGSLHPLAHLIRQSSAFLNTTIQALSCPFSIKSTELLKTPTEVFIFWVVWSYSLYLTRVFFYPKDLFIHLKGSFFVKSLFFESFGAVLYITLAYPLTPCFILWGKSLESKKENIFFW